MRERWLGSTTLESCAVWMGGIPYKLSDLLSYEEYPPLFITACYPTQRRSQNGYHGILQSVNRITTTLRLLSAIHYTKHFVNLITLALHNVWKYLPRIRLQKSYRTWKSGYSTACPIDCNHMCLDMINLHIIVFSSTDTEETVGININYDSGTLGRTKKIPFMDPRERKEGASNKDH